MGPSAPAAIRAPSLGEGQEEAVPSWGGQPESRPRVTPASLRQVSPRVHRFFWGCTVAVTGVQQPGVPESWTWRGRQCVLFWFCHPLRVWRTAWSCLYLLSGGAAPSLEGRLGAACDAHPARLPWRAERLLPKVNILGHPDERPGQLCRKLRPEPPGIIINPLSWELASRPESRGCLTNLTSHPS